MDSASLAAPGQPAGPCLDPNCGHFDCEANRALAARLCAYCGEPIGFETAFHWQDPNPPIHIACLKETIERR